VYFFFLFSTIHSFAFSEQEEELSSNCCWSLNSSDIDDEAAMAKARAVNLRNGRTGGEEETLQHTKKNI
jgi:hypothetical protein